MALQKPVVCYLRDEDLKFLPPLMRAEFADCQCDEGTNLYEVLKDLLTIRRTELIEIGRRGRAYVERWHDPVQIAHELAHEYHAIANRRWKAKLSSVEQRSSSRNMWYERTRRDRREGGNLRRDATWIGGFQGHCVRTVS